ncbi:MAG: hypothetical protein M3365_06020 [Gemmatimonadota bacterium]|nr:hypothetical protein [Gemmatimonadota bacterium]
MSNTPHRPFVAKRATPERAVPQPADFRVVRPFVHGQATSYQAAPPESAESKPLASIADFLAMDYPAPIADFLAADAPAPVANFLTTDAPTPITEFVGTESRPEPATYEGETDVYELPPMEHFTDTISEEESASATYDESMMDPFGPTNEQPPSDPYGWEETDWQRYDWRAAAALGDAGDPAASSAWAQTDWGIPASSAKNSRDSAAKAIADVLDGIARRIRDGDLVMPPSPAAVPDPATIAATLAALLRVRR